MLDKLRARDEWKLFQFMDPNHVDDAMLELRLGKVFPDGEALDAYRDALPGVSAHDLFGAAITDLVFRQPAIRLSFRRRASRRDRPFRRIRSTRRSRCRGR